MIELFEKVKASLDGQDWCTEEKAVTLASLVIALRPKIVVEIGVWTGGSLIPMAIAAKALGTWTDIVSCRDTTCKVIAIDPWSQAASAAGQIPINAAWWASAPHEWAYEVFLSRVAKFELEGVLEIQRCRSSDYTPPVNIGLLHVDGNHGPQAVDDVIQYGPMVGPGGVVVLDDFHWDGGAVERAGDILMGIGFYPRYELDTKSFGRVFQRVGMR